jgi:nucleotide-binding universal stress UspA family protein
MTYGILPHVLEGTAVETLSRLINEWQIDLLVCGTASGATEAHNKFGSVAESLLPHVRCSMLAFKPQRTIA